MKSQRDLIVESFKHTEHSKSAYNHYVTIMNDVLCNNMDELKLIIDNLPDINGDEINSEFRKKYNIHIHVMMGSKEGYSMESEVWDYNPELPYYYSYCFVNTKTGNAIRDKFNENYYGSDLDTYEEALNAGIKHLSELIKNKEL